MRKTQAINLGILMLAASLTGCNNNGTNEVRDCVDKDNRIVADSNCQSPAYHGGAQPRWVYGGSSGGRTGDYVVGGRETVAPTVTSVPRSSLTTESGSFRGGSVSTGGFGTHRASAGVGE